MYIIGGRGSQNENSGLDVLLIILARAVSPRESFTVNKYLRNTALFGLLLGVSLAAQARERTATGWISDENCGARHTKPGGAGCIKKCMHGGQDIGHPEWKPQRM